MNESDLQRKAGRLVESEVYLNISHMVEALLTAGGHRCVEYWDGSNWATMEDFENLFTPVCSLCLEPAEEEDMELEVCEHCGEELEVDHQPQEIFEYWAVSNWLARMLSAAGQPICHDFHGLNVWGRCTTGQAILLDHVIRALVEKEAA